MAIVITTNDKDGGLPVSQKYENREEVKNAVQAPKVQEETKSEPSASEQENNEQVKDEFDYLNRSEEEEESTEDDLDTEEDESDEEEHKPKKNGFKKRIDKLTKKNSDYEKRIAELEAKLTNNSNNTNNPKEEVKVEEIKEPKIEDFEEYSDYLKALTKFEINEENKKKQLEAKNKEIQAEAENVLKKWQEKVLEAKEFYGEEEWNSLGKIDLPMSEHTRYKLMQNPDIGTHVLYYLFHNPEEAKKLASLPAIDQISHLTRLEDKIASKISKVKEEKKSKVEAKKISKAPEPVKPVDNSKSKNVGAKDPSKMSTSEYLAWRNSQRKKK